MDNLIVNSITLTEANEKLSGDAELDIATLMAIQGAICKMEYMAKELRTKLAARLADKSLSDISTGCGGDADNDEVTIEVPCTGKNVSGVLLKYKLRTTNTMAVNEEILLAANKVDEAVRDGVVKKEVRYKINTPKIKELNKSGNLPDYVNVSFRKTEKLVCSETVVPIKQPEATN